MKKYLRVLISFLLVFSLFGCRAKDNKPVYIIYTNDVHCSTDNVIGYQTVAAMKTDLLNQGVGVVLVDAGDYLQGGSLGNLTKGASVVEAMNTAAYDVAGLGNHEFDFGADRLNENINAAKFDIVSCNVSYSGAKEGMLANVKPYVIKDLMGVKVAFVGISTPETMITAGMRIFKENDELVFDFKAGENGTALYEQVQNTVDEARKAGAQYVVALAHLGTDDGSVPYRSYDLISATSGIDVVVDSHSHSVITGEKLTNKDGNEVILTSTGTGFEHIGEMVIYPDGMIRTMLIDSYSSEDENTARTINNQLADLEKMLETVVAETPYRLAVDDTDGVRMVRNRETNLANLFTDALRLEYGADMALVNGGAIRKTIEAGDITFNDLLSVLPFQNLTACIRITGQQVLDALEFGARAVKSVAKADGAPVGEIGGFLQTSGLRYTIDTSIESTCVVDENNMLKSIGDVRRVKDVEVLVNGEYVPIDPEATYTVAGSAYLLLSNGDGYSCFDDCEILSSEGVIDTTVFMNYVIDTLGGVIPEHYSVPEGRITVK